MSKKCPPMLPACADCGMIVERDEYHPYAACVIYKFTKCSKTTRENIQAVRDSLLNEKKDPTGRTPKDYAIEHAEYMATAAEHYMNTMNAALTEDIDLGESQDSISDAWQNLRSMIFEFRKRAARA